MTTVAPEGQLKNRLRVHCLFRRKMIIKYDWDWWSLQTGGERVGKSTNAMQEAWYVDPTLFRNLDDRLAYDGEGWLNLVDGARKGQALILDEPIGWWRQTWWEDINQALDKTAVIVGYKCLAAFILSPTLKLVSPQAVRRAAGLNGSWSHVDAPGFVRGHMELHKGRVSKYGETAGKGPYWETKLDHYFLPLPGKIYDHYFALKQRKSDEVIAKFSDKARYAAHPGSESLENVETILGEIRKDRAGHLGLRNKRGHFDFAEIWYRYRDKGLSTEKARIVARRLTKEFPAAT